MARRAGGMRRLGTLEPASIPCRKARNNRAPARCVRRVGIASVDALHRCATALLTAIRLFTIVADRNLSPFIALRMQNEPESHTRHQLSADRLTELDSVARGYLSEQITEDEVERVITAVSRHARETGMKAEELIVTCKELWRTLPADVVVSERGARSKKLERMVQICIEGYFADR